MELAFFLLIMSRRHIAFKQYQELTAFTIDEVSNFDWHELARFDPSSGSPLALIADLFKEKTRPSPFDSAFFTSLIENGFFNGMDRLPYRELEFSYAVSRLQGVDVESDLIEAFDRTAFGRGHSLVRYSLDDTYSLTHALFYLTDLGLRPAAYWSDRLDVSRLQRTLVALIVMMARADHGDVLGELLICWLMCGLVPSTSERVVIDAALASMLSRVTKGGAVPPTSTTYKRLQKGEARFAEVYHTTLVAAILFRLASLR